ncbi:MAG: hypothetical protein II625_06445 [Bacilli bacterium]|nr:hypothetical protein [Bacilli bacterium]
MKKTIELIQKNKDAIILTVLFFIMLAISYLFPVTHDDWFWSSSQGIELLKSHFQTTNGRWAGNLLILLLSRHRLLRSITIAVFLTLLVQLIKKITGSNKTSTYAIISLLLVMPIKILAQAVAWTSGFANYVPPVVLFLLFMYLNKNVFKGKEPGIKNWFAIIMLPLGFVSTLFMENITIYILIVSIVLFIYLLIKYKKINIPNLFYMIGSIGGTVLMFSCEVYRKISNSEDVYRTIEKSNVIIRALKTYFKELYNYLVQYNTVLNIVLGVLILILIYRFYKAIKKNLKIIPNLLLKCSSLIIIGYLTYNTYLTIMGGGNIFIVEKYKLYLEAFMSLLFMLSIFIAVLFVIKSKERKARLIFEIVSIFLVAGPLLIVTPIGPRCFFVSYVFFVILTIELFNEVLQDKENDYICNILAIVALLVIVSHLSIYRYAYKIEHVRIEYINKHQEDKKIVLPSAPNARYVWGFNPVGYLNEFKKYYGIDEEKEVVFINYTEWYRNYYKKSK